MRLKPILLSLGIAVWSAGICWSYLVQRRAPPRLDDMTRFGAGLLCCAFFLCIFTAAGRPIVRILLRRHATTDLELALYGFGIGSALFSLVIFILANVGLLFGWLLLVLAAIGGFLAVFSDFSKPLQDARKLLPPWSLLFLLPFFGLAAMCALAEPGSTDAILYHLSVPAYYLRQHLMAPIPNNFFSFWPMACEMLYAFGLSVAGETAPALLNLGFCLAVLLLLQHMGKGSVWISPALIFLSMPTATINAGYPYVDYALTFYVIASYAALDRFIETRGRGWLLLSGLLSSAAISAKYTGFYALAAMLVILATRRFPGKSLRIYAPYMLALLVFAGPWLARNSIYTGNPIYPYFQKLFKTDPGTYRAERQAYELNNIQGELREGWISWLQIPYYYSFKQPFLDDVIGPALALMLPFFFLSIARRRDILIFMLVFCAVWALMSPQARHLLPVLGLLSIAASDGLSQLRNRAGVAFISVAFFVILMTNFYHCLFYYHLAFNPARRVIGAESCDEYLTRNLNDYPAALFINSVLRPDACILTIGQMDSFHIHRKIYPESKYDTPLAVSLARGCRSPEEFTRKLQGLGFTHILINSGEIRRMSWIPGEYMDWKNQEEKRIFDDAIRLDCRLIFNEQEVAIYSLMPLR